MKKILLFLFLAYSLSGFAQDKKALEAGAQKVYDLMSNENYTKILDHTYPKLFDIVPRATMEDAMTKLFKGDGYSISFLPVAPNFSFSEIKKIDGGNYALVSHDLKMKMIYDEELSEENEDMMLNYIKQVMEAEEVSYNKNEKAIIIKKRSQMIAVSDSLTNNQWKFVNNDKSKLIEMLFSQNVRAELGI